jgi:hypothetical protein
MASHMAHDHALTPPNPKQIFTTDKTATRPSRPRSAIVPHHMIVYWLTIAVFAASLFTLAILTVTSAPPRNADLRSALAPTDTCPEPCFLGIRPGETTADQAYAQLIEHEWVESVNYGGRASAPLLQWSWNGAQPRELDRGDFDPYMLLDQDNIVQIIYLPTRIAYGDIWDILGEPQQARVMLTGRASPYTRRMRWMSVNHAANYFGGTVEVVSLSACPFSVESFWKAPISITFYAPSYIPPDLPPYTAPTWFKSQPC